MSENDPYVEFKPGDLIAAEVFNDLQMQIRDDISEQAQAAVDGIIQVPRAEDSDKLEGQTLAEIRQAIIDQAVGEVSRRSGYTKLYKKLQVGEWKDVKHDLQNCPLVDVYQLLYFRVVASEDDYKYLTWVNFYIYHSGEKRIRYVPESDSPISVEVEPSEGMPYRLSFKELLEAYKVDYTDDSNLGEIETEFWDAIFSDPNDRFDDNQYTHSPWFDRCCREERTVRSLKQRGDWDDIWVKVMPSKTINYPFEFSLPAGADDQGVLSVPDVSNPLPRPTQIEVAHYDLNALGVKLLSNPVPQWEVVRARRSDVTQEEVAHIPENELKVMLLLRA